ncbi:MULTISPECIES: DUF2059 domain-containing protein [unclassified Shewanella]|uniref:DUF2059 domain-containing protein n=1 Tax=unclassified Shewanella TaxID=196818 RepID=UPI001BBC0EA5|nr:MULTISPECIES: DUF2059 domain-containing protein [unclassified Shewanella]GIU05183.1 hypothetical protein TUM4444_01120 [Shewanella sp. MBTL60-112-B1]GIU24303.1 hypothetical protein TUM4445_01250 [Shewanella sp. MBTL60-112-B2]
MIRLWILLSVFVANIAFAADEDSKRRQASALLTVIKAEKMLQQEQFKLQGQYSHLLKDYRIPANQRVLEDLFREKAFDYASQTLSWEQLEPPIIEAYAKQYTEEELLSLTRFFGSDIGQKFLKTQPKLAANVDHIVSKQRKLVSEQFTVLIAEFVKQAGLTQPLMPSHDSAAHHSPNSHPIAPPSKSSQHIGH